MHIDYFFNNSPILSHEDVNIITDAISNHMDEHSYVRHYLSDFLSERFDKIEGSYGQGFSSLNGPIYVVTAESGKYLQEGIISTMAKSSNGLIIAAIIDDNSERNKDNCIRLIEKFRKVHRAKSINFDMLCFYSDELNYYTLSYYGSIFKRNLCSNRYDLHMLEQFLVEASLEDGYNLCITSFGSASGGGERISVCDAYGKTGALSEHLNILPTRRGAWTAFLLEIASTWLCKYWHELYYRYHIIFGNSDLLSLDIDAPVSTPKDLGKQLYTLFKHKSLYPQVFVDKGRATIVYYYFDYWQGLIKQTALIKFLPGNRYTFEDNIHKEVMYEYSCDIVY